MKISLKQLQSIIGETLAESAMELNSIEADLVELPPVLEQAVKSLSGLFQVEMVKPQSPYGTFGDDTTEQVEKRQAKVKEVSQKLLKSLRHAVLVALSEVERDDH